MPPPKSLGVMGDGVEYIEAEVLDPIQQSYITTGKPMVDQFAAQMVEDARQFAQGMSQIFAAGIGQGIAIAVKDDGAKLPQGMAIIAGLENAMKFLPIYAQNMGIAAASVTQNWSNTSLPAFSWTGIMPYTPPSTAGGGGGGSSSSSGSAKNPSSSSQHSSKSSSSSKGPTSSSSSAAHKSPSSSSSSKNSSPAAGKHQE